MTGVESLEATESPKTTESSRATWEVSTRMVWICFAIHFLLDMVLAFFPMFESTERTLWAFTLVTSQVSLMAAGFAVLSIGRRYYELSLDVLYSETVWVYHAVLAYTAVSAIVGFTTWIKRTTRVLIATTLFGLLLTWLISLTLVPVIRWIFSDRLLVSQESFILCIGNYCFVTATLLICHLPFGKAAPNVKESGQDKVLNGYSRTG